MTEATQTVKTRMFPFRLEVHPTDGLPFHTPYRTREEMKKGIDDAVKARTVGAILPLTHDGNAWVDDRPSRQYMATLATPKKSGAHKSHFKAAAALFASLAKVDVLDSEQRQELSDVVEQAFMAAHMVDPAEYETSGVDGYALTRASHGLT